MSEEENYKGSRIEEIRVFMPNGDIRLISGEGIHSAQWGAGWIGVTLKSDENHKAKSLHFHGLPYIVSFAWGEKPTHLGTMGL